MAYINFKEERYALSNQIKNRNLNNASLCNKLRKKSDEIYTDIDELYKFREISDVVFENHNIHKEQYEVVTNTYVNVIFRNCKFYNVKFVKSKFIGCKFIGCILNDIIFEDCVFIEEKIENMSILNKVDNLSCSFYKCEIYAKFVKCDLSLCLFETCEIINTNIEQTNCKKIIIHKSEIDNVRIKDCNLSGFKTLETYIEDFYFEDNGLTKLDEKTFFDVIKFKNHTNKEYIQIYKTYKIIASKFCENGMSNRFGEYYYISRKIQRKSISGFKKFWSYIQWAVCGYGERPLNCVYTSIILIVVYALLYLLAGAEIHGEIITYTSLYEMSLEESFYHINQAFNLSVGMFCGVGYNDVSLTEVSTLISSLEMLTGVVMTGLGIGTLIRKVVR